MKTLVFTIYPPEFAFCPLGLFLRTGWQPTLPADPRDRECEAVLRWREKAMRDRNAIQQALDSFIAGARNDGE